MADRLRIGIFANDLGVGGTQRVVQSLACSLPQDTTEVTAISLRGGPREKPIREAGIGVEICDDSLSRLTETLSRRKVEVFHVNHTGLSEPGLLEAVSQAGVPAIVETNVFGLLDRSPASRLIDARVFVSHTCKDRYLHWLGKRADGAGKVVIYNPVDVGKWQSAAGLRDQFRRSHGIAADTRLFGFVSQKLRWDRDMLTRHVATFVRALDTTARPWRLACVGMPEPLREVCARDPVLARRILPIPEVCDDESLAAVYHGIDAYAHLAKLGEACPTVIQEAMACGRPVIVRYVPAALNNGQCEIVDSGETGYAVGGGMVEMARSAAELLDQPDRLVRFGAAALAKATRMYDSSVIARQYLAIYVEAVLRRRPERELPGELDALRRVAGEMLAQESLSESAWRPNRLSRCQYGMSPIKRRLVLLGMSPWLYQTKKAIKSIAAIPNRLRRS